MLNKRQKHLSSKHRRGVAAVVMILVMMIVGMMVTSLAMSTGRDQDLTVRRIETIQAFYAAEAGVNMAVRELMLNSDEDGDGAIGTISNDADDATDPEFGIGTVVVTSAAQGDQTLLTATGSANGTDRVLQLTLE